MGNFSEHQRGFSVSAIKLEAKTRALAGWKGYTTNLTGRPAAFVIDAYHQLWRIEKAFRMSKHDLRPARSTTAPATPSKPTSASCSRP